jgi:hypothetical protein
MIAPLRLPEPHTSEQRRRLRKARRVVAAAFLEPRSESGDGAPRIAGWRAWLFAAWVAVVTGVYMASMIGLL